jgi:hypothetical protein
MEGKNPKFEYEKGSSSGSTTKVDLPNDDNQNPKVEKNKEDNEDLESITDLLDLSPELEIEDKVIEDWL